MQLLYTKKVTTSVRIEFEEREDGRATEREGVLCIGHKGLSDMTRRQWARLMRRAVRESLARQYSEAQIDFDAVRIGAMANASESDVAYAFAHNVVIASYDFRTFKTAPKTGWRDLKKLFVTGTLSRDGEAALKAGAVLGKEVNAARELANMPAGDMTPSTLAASAKAAVKGLKISVKVLGRKEMEKLKMGALLGVGKGSAHEPKLIVLEYRGGAKNDKPIALVGKGITFDSGGINIKPSNGGSLEEMHLDMSGGAAVIHAIAASARLGLKKNVVALVAAAENMVSGESYRPGDILRSMSGKTIEVLNTDAEGRLVMADAFTYAQKNYSPRLMIDVATLTGAAIVALGTYASAAVSLDHSLAERVRELGAVAGDEAWPLPLLKEFASCTASKRADVANIPMVHSRDGGTITAAAFLAEFVDEHQPWVHIDMAPRMTAVAGDHLADGATGEPVRLLVECIREM